MKKAGRLFSLALCGALLLSACGGSGDGGSSSGNEGSSSQSTDVVAAVSLDFTTMDPVDTSDTLSGGIQRLIMDGLFGFDDKMGQIPMLATGYTANDDATEYVITLREGISFSDGTPWDAAAAKANLDKLGDKTRGLKRTSLLSNILKSVEVTGDYEVTVTLTQPFGAFIATLAHPACVMMSPKVLEAGDDQCRVNPVGTGQYKFVEWEQGDHLTIQLNPDWWGYEAGIADKDAGFKSIKFQVVTENATRVSMLQSGDAQFIWPVPTESFATLEADSSLNVFAEEGIVVYYLTMNTQKTPFTDIRVRQAFNYAIDKDAYISVIMNGLGSKATSIIGPAVAGYKGNEPYPYDVDKAKELLKEAGYENGFEITMYYSSNTTNEKAAQFMQQQLEKVGVTLKLVGQESAITNALIQDCTKPGSEAEVDVYRTGWSPSTGDADWGLRPLLHSESEPPANYNMSYFENDEFDRLVYAALETADQNARNDYYAQAQDIVWAELPIVPLANSYNTWATSNKLSNVKIYPDGAINIRNAKME